ncbi:Not1 N-terminal domain, CCR4-Not complex component-domain-containing protein [Syncephalis plumigaleata]|nr:Not1 N-terminal domain, CCR4-Not complex component-domain-containing protein [Syncephalis plumigaleata]
MASRKLQAEIDRVFKKVSEGVETFDAIFRKLEGSDNFNQKEKHEQDLKKEIKKLQRLRDQIKNWISSSEIKDKTPLVDQRRLIEQKMELFKACEKEMKTKAFSKEGLTLAARMDPKDKEKQEISNWITRTVEDLSTQIDGLEAEAERLQVGLRKNKKSSEKYERISAIDDCVQRHKWHMGRLELILRLLENGNVTSDQVQRIRDDVEYYAENNQDPDFAEDEEIYDELNLEAEEELYAIGMNEDLQSSHGSVSDSKELTMDKSTDDIKLDASPRKSTEVVVESGSTKLTLVKASSGGSLAPKEPPSSRKSAKDLAQNISRGSTPTVTHIDRPDSPSPASNTSAAPSPARKQTTAQLYSVTAQASLNNNSTNSTTSIVKPSSIKASGPTIADVVAGTVGKQSASAKTNNNKVNETSTATSMKMTTSTDSISSNISKDSIKTSPNLTTITHPDTTTSTESTAVKDANAPSAIRAKIPAGADQPPSAALADLIATFETAKQKARARHDLGQYQQILDQGCLYLPGSLDAERSKQYIPKNVHPTPAYYPTTPSPLFDNPLLFDKLSSDALFFIFYYQQGTYQQYLAARSLKKKSWRYHKKYQTWFQRHEEPVAITDEYEMGTYIYFDYEGAWCQRKKTEFRFEYRYLEDAELV